MSFSREGESFVGNTPEQKKILGKPWERFEDLEKELPAIIWRVTEKRQGQNFRDFAKTLSVNIGAVLGTTSMACLEYGFAIEGVIKKRIFGRSFI